MFKKLVYSLITKIAVALVNFSILLISSRYLGVSTRGEISIFILNITILQFINEIYSGYHIIHFIPKFDFKRLVLTGLIYSLICCSFGNLLVVFMHQQLIGYEWMAYVISLLIILNTFNCVLILGKENLNVYNLLSFVQPFLLLIALFLFIFVLKIYTIAAFIYPLLISFSLAFIVSSIVMARYFFSTTNDSAFKLKPILINGILYQSAGLLFVFSNRLSYYILPDTAGVGLYSSASSLMESSLFIVNGISTVLLSRIANQNKLEANIETTLSLAKVSLALTAFLALIVFFIPDSFFLFLLGNGFSGIKGIMLSYAPAVILAGFFMVLGSYFVASGNQKVLVFCYAIGFCSSVFLAPMLIKKYGIIGAALNADISYALIFLSMCTFFILNGKIKPAHFFSFHQDIKIIKRFVSRIH